MSYVKFMIDLLCYDQVTSKTETLVIEGEGRKVEELKAREAEKAVEKQVSGAQLKTAQTKGAAEASVRAESLVGRQGSVVGELQVLTDDVATSTLEPGQKQKVLKIWFSIYKIDVKKILTCLGLQLSILRNIVHFH
jgi:hypothetical protein